jgi:hypothetical protein
MNDGESSRRNTETPQIIGSGGAMRRLMKRVHRCPFWDFGYHELERQRFRLSKS